MAMVSPMNPMLNPNTKDSRWLTLEVCREYQRNKCTRTENECKFAHPPPHVEVQNGRVIACFDSIKGKCQRKDPPCKYLHPPQHLREQLLQNGRNNLILKSLQIQALHQQVIPGIIPVAGGKAVAYPALLPGQIPYVIHPDVFSSHHSAPHYLSTVPTPGMPQFSPYMTGTIPGTMTVPSGTDGTMVTQQIPGVISTQLTAAKASNRPDRLEPQVVEVLTPSKKRPRDPADDLVLGAPQMGLTMPPFKRVAVADGNLGKSGIPMYQPATLGAYHQAAIMQHLQQQPYIPVTYSTEMMSSAYANYLPTVTGHTPTVPRF